MTKSQQRFRLGELYAKGPNYYHATFDHITHKVNHQKKKIPVILLTDVYLVDKDDNKIRMMKSNDFRDKKGRHIVADHLWVKMTKPWFEVKEELLAGDEVYFSAEVEKYKIVRKDAIDKRDAIYNEAKKKCDDIYKRWSRYTDNHKRKNFELSLKKMKSKQKEIMAKAKRNQSNIELVDYSLNKVKAIKVVIKVTTNSNYKRKIYNYEQYKYQGYKYTAWLAARSMAFKDTH